MALPSSILWLITSRCYLVTFYHYQLVPGFAQVMREMSILYATPCFQQLIKRPIHNHIFAKDDVNMFASMSRFRKHLVSNSTEKLYEMEYRYHLWTGAHQYMFTRLNRIQNHLHGFVDNEWFAWLLLELAIVLVSLDETFTALIHHVHCHSCRITSVKKNRINQLHLKNGYYVEKHQSGLLLDHYKFIVFKSWVNCYLQ